jgi:hypothetical protein
MLNINRDNIMWAWVCPHTGIVFDEGWAATEAWAAEKTRKWLGKRRFETGEMKAVRVRLEVLSDEEAQEQRAAFEAFSAELKSA